MDTRVNPSKAFQNILAASKASGGWTNEDDGDPVVVVLEGRYVGSWLFKSHPNRTVWSDGFSIAPRSFGGLHRYQEGLVGTRLQAVQDAFAKTKVPLFWAPKVRIPFTSNLNTRQTFRFYDEWRRGSMPTRPTPKQRRVVLNRLGSNFEPVLVAGSGKRQKLSNNYLVWRDLYIFMNLSGLSAESLAAKLSEYPS